MFISETTFYQFVYQQQTLISLDDVVLLVHFIDCSLQYKHIHIQHFYVFLFYCNQFHGKIAGWGKTSSDLSSGHTGTAILQTASVPIISMKPTKCFIENEIQIILILIALCIRSCH